MAIKIKITPADELKILKENSRKLLLARQVHKNKKAYSRRVKHKKVDY
jgi:hypothetical protein